jgi:uncharacterized SAM-binding protein YcdF (DUF218 family)
VIDGFLLKKLVSVFVHVIPGVPLLLLFALLSRRWYPRFSTVVSLLLVGLLIALSMPPISNFFIARLENRYEPLLAAPDDTGLILVLGYGHHDADDRPPNSILSASALSRITEGVRLWKTMPDATLAVSGAGLYGAMSHAQAMKNMALALSVPEAKITTFEKARDTADEIATAARSVTNLPDIEAQRLVVVSSATHLPRAALMLAGKEVTFTMAPTDYLAGNAPWYRAGSGSLHHFDRALHEWVGMFWHRLTHKHE